MHHFIRFILLLFFVISGNFSGVNIATAAQPKQAGKAEVNKPSATVSRSTRVYVQQTGTDTIGIHLATRLKELFNGSNLFELHQGDNPKIGIIITSKAEFKDRPHVGSVYSLLWVFSRSNNHLGYLLAHEVDVLSSEDVNDAARRIVERTDGLSVKYNYLFK